MGPSDLSQKLPGLETETMIPLGYVTWLSDWTLQKMVGVSTVHSFFFFICNMEEFWECWYRILHTPNVRVVFVDGCNESINPHPTRPTSDPSTCDTDPCLSGHSAPACCLQ